MEKVRYVGRPHEELEVTEQEATDLRALGLLAQDITDHRVGGPKDNRTPAGSGGKDKE